MSQTLGEGRANTYVALLRGINLAGKNKLLMRDLAAIFVDAGCTNVQTYIQSGNVVFSAMPKLADRVSQLISRRIAELFQLKVPVVLRSADELNQVATGNPMLKSRTGTEFLHVGFLADRPGQNRVSALDPNRSPGDTFAVCGREIYLCLPNGMAKTKFTNAYFDSALGTTSTFRNWRTVLELQEIMRTIG